MYFKDGAKSMGDYFNNKPIGKHVFLQPNWEVIKKEYAK